MEAQLIGTLTIDETTNCLLALSAGYQIDVAWPRCWTTAIHDGTAVLLDDTGKVVRKVGEEIALGGGFVPPADINVTSCTNADTVFATSGLSQP